MFKNILVCLDGSKLAEYILPYVADEALLHRSRVVLIQVVSSPVVVTPGVPGASGGTVVPEPSLRRSEKAEDEAVRYLRGVAEQLRGKGINVEMVTAIGTAGHEIVSYAASNDIDLIALATHGRGGFGRAIFGSVANFVLRESGMPILLIKPKAI